MSLRRRLVFSVLSAIVAVAVAYSIAEAWAWSREGFGRGDLSALWLWNAPFGLGLLVVSLLCAGPFLRGDFLWSVVLPLVTGALYGFAFTVLNRAWLGPWFGAWSFPVLYCWVAGGAVGLGLSVMLSRVF